MIAYDGTDKGAFDRRLAAREAHLKSAKNFYDSGAWIFAAAILNNNGTMIGSMVVCDFPSQNELEEQWFKNEPYITGNVWNEIEVTRAQIAPFCDKK